MSSIAVLGLGRMGSALAGRLLDTGHPVTVWNRSPGKAGGLVERGARESTSASEAATGAEVVFTSLTDDDAVRSVVLDTGLLGALGPGAVLVDASTVSPATGGNLRDAVGEERFIAMPVLGAPPVFASGHATLLLGGRRDLVESHESLWADIAKTRRYAGSVESALVLKLSSNLLLVTGVTALAEAVTLALSCGVDADELRDFLGSSPALAPGVASRLDAVIDHKHEGWWAPLLAAKDARLAQETARLHKRTLPVTELVEQRLTDTASAGWQDSDLSAVVELTDTPTG
jgi:3-hydroxyisobutyrate dehydrogenase-like beta-hydroxyacid dehydrogenase